LGEGCTAGGAWRGCSPGETPDGGSVSDAVGASGVSAGLGLLIAGGRTTFSTSMPLMTGVFLTALPAAIIRTTARRCIMSEIANAHPIQRLRGTDAVAGVLVSSSCERVISSNRLLKNSHQAFVLASPFVRRSAATPPRGLSIGCNDLTIFEQPESTAC